MYYKFRHFPNVLLGGFWHATSVERFEMILHDGFISPEPPIPESDRWSHPDGPEFYPYVRKLGGVSLFDFTDFDPIEYTKKYDLSNWHIFVPFQESWGASIWIEIHREAIQSNLINGKELDAKHLKDRAYKNRIMPRIEAAHIGELPVSAFRRVLVSSSKNPKLTPYETK